MGRGEKCGTVCATDIASSPPSLFHPLCLCRISAGSLSLPHSLPPSLSDDFSLFHRRFLSHPSPLSLPSCKPVRRSDSSLIGRCQISVGIKEHLQHVGMSAFGGQMRRGFTKLCMFKEQHRVSQKYLKSPGWHEHMSQAAYTCQHAHESHCGRERFRGIPNRRAPQYLRGES